MKVLITPRGETEVWQRTIGSWGFSTIQEQQESVLRERYGLLSFDLRVTRENGGLSYCQDSLGVELGPIRVRIPGPLAVHVQAHELPAPDPQLTKVTVRLDLPLVGLLVAYSGVLERA